MMLQARHEILVAMNFSCSSVLSLLLLLFVS